MKKIFRQRYQKNRPALWGAILIIIVILPLALLKLKSAEIVAAAWFNESWSYRKVIQIPSHTSLENNVYVTVPAFDATDTSLFQADCGDLRFTKQNGELLPYYVVDCDATADIHVQFDTLPAGESSYYMYYGNSSVDNGFSSSDFSTAATGLGSQSLGSQEISPAPIAYWKFDEGYGQTINDSTQSNNNGTLGANSSPASDDPSWQDESMCVSGKCLYFDGTDDKTLVPDEDSLHFGTNDFSISLWMKATSTLDTYDVIFSKANGLNHYNYVNSLFLAYGELRWYVNDSSETLWNNWVTLGIPSTFTNTWSHITLVREGSNIYGYLNGQLVDSSAIPADYNLTSTQPIEMGYDSSIGTYYKGLIDDVKIYPHARSADQIKTDYASRGSTKGVSTSIGSQNPNTSLSQGLVGYWKMDEASTPALDSSGNGNNGTWSNSPTLSTGKFGNSLTHNGSNSAVNLGTHTLSSFSTEDFTLTAWINQSSSDSLKKVIFKGNPYCDGCDSGYTIYTTSGSPRFLVDLSSSTGDTYTTNDPSTTINDGSWHLVVGQKKGDIINIFVDGILVDSTSLPAGSSISSIGDSLTISGTSYAYDGSIDEVRIYNRALSSAEVRKLYNYAPGPLVHFPLDEGSGSNTYDTAGGNTGVLTSSPIWVSGKYGKGLQFSNPDDNYVSFTPTTSLNSANENFTTSVWFKNVSVGTYMVSKSGGGVYIGRSGNNITFRVNPGVSASCTSTSNPSADSNWHYATLTWDGDTLKGYIDSKLECTNVTTSGSISLGTTLWHIGHRPSLSGITGILDDFRIYNYVRTPGQIIQDMNAGHPIGGSPIGSQFYYYKLDEGYGTTAQDSSINQHTATWYGTGSHWSNSGKFNKSAIFNGTDDYLDNPNYAPDYDSFTVTGWFNMDSSRSASSDPEPIFGNNQNTPFLGYQPSSKSFKHLRQYDGGSETESWANSTNLADDNWHYVALVVNQSTYVANLYLDGIPLGEESFGTEGHTHSNGDFSKIGMDYASYFKGYIDEVKIYRTALTPDQVYLDMSRGSSMVLGATGTNSSGNPSSSSDRAYCVPGDNSSCSAPVAEWSFDEGTGTSTYDASENSNTGTLGGGVEGYRPTWSLGKIGKGLKFDGDDDRVDIADHSSLNFGTSSFTVEAWIKKSIVAEQTTFIQKLASTTDPGYVLYQHNGDNVAFLISESGATYNVAYASPINDNEWHHIVGVVDYTSGTMYVYRDGVKGTPSTITISGTTTNTEQLNFGRRWGFLDGSMDHIKLYDYARTPAQVAWDYSRGAPVGHWKLDECSGTVANDSSGNGNSGTITIGGTGTNTTPGTCSTSGSWADGVTGKFNSSLEFDGTDDIVNIPHSNSLDMTTNNFSVSAWAKTSSSSNLNIIDKGGTNASAAGWRLQIRNGQIWVAASGGDTVNRPNCTIGSGYNDNVWHSITAVFNRGTDLINVYSDGSYVGNCNISTITGQSLSNSGIGVALSYSSQQFSGQIDDVRIYNYALTLNQIKSIMNGGSSTRFGPSTGQP